MKIIGVTKCPTGIAHTYMAAERLQITGEKLGYEMHIETQGSQGTENMLTARQIAEADYVIIAADVAIEGIEVPGKKDIPDIHQTGAERYQTGVSRYGGEGREDGRNGRRR